VSIVTRAKYFAAKGYLFKLKRRPEVITDLDPQFWSRDGALFFYDCII